MSEYETLTGTGASGSFPPDGPETEPVVTEAMVEAGVRAAQQVVTTGEARTDEEAFAIDIQHDYAVARATIAAALPLLAQARDGVQAAPKEGDWSTWTDSASGETGLAQFHKGDWRERDGALAAAWQAGYRECENNTHAKSLADQMPPAAPLTRLRPEVRDIGIVGPVNGMNEPDLSGPYLRVVLTKNDARDEYRISLGAAEVLAGELTGLLYGESGESVDRASVLEGIAANLDAEADNLSPTQNVYPANILRNTATRLRALAASPSGVQAAPCRWMLDAIGYTAGCTVCGVQHDTDKPQPPCPRSTQAAPRAGMPTPFGWPIDPPSALEAVREKAVPEAGGLRTTKEERAQWAKVLEAEADASLYRKSALNLISDHDTLTRLLQEQAGQIAAWQERAADRNAEADKYAKRAWAAEATIATALYEHEKQTIIAALRSLPDELAGPRSGFIYAIQMGDLPRVKIGFAANTKRRLKERQTDA